MVNQLHQQHLGLEKYVILTKFFAVKYLIAMWIVQFVQRLNIKKVLCEDQSIFLQIITDSLDIEDVLYLVNSLLILTLFNHQIQIVLLLATNLFYLIHLVKALRSI